MNCYFSPTDKQLIMFVNNYILSLEPWLSCADPNNFIDFCKLLPLCSNNQNVKLINWLLQVGQ